MPLILTSAGSFPRIGESTQSQLHRRAYAQHERGEISESEWQAVEDEVTRTVVAEQVAAGLDLPTDGQVRWYDPVSHLARSLANVTINGLLRFFDTNCYFRQPVVTGRLARTRPVLAREYRVAREASPSGVKPVLTGPYSLAQASILEGGYASRDALALAYAEVLAEEIGELGSEGADVIQVDEPFLLRHPEDLAVVRETFGILASRRGAARLACYTFFGDALPLYDGLQALPVDLLGFDFTYSPGLARRVSEAGSDKTLALGLFDGRNTKLETADTVFPLLDRVMSRLAGDAYVNPSCGLEYLPRARARAKLDTMVSLVRGWETTGGAR